MEPKKKQETMNLGDFLANQPPGPWADGKGAPASSSDSAFYPPHAPHLTVRDPMKPEDEELFPGPSVALYSFEPENRNELRLVAGQEIVVSSRHGQGWVMASDPRSGAQGLVPEAYVRLIADMPNYDPETGQFVDIDQLEYSKAMKEFLEGDGQEKQEGGVLDHLALNQLPPQYAFRDQLPFPDRPPYTAHLGNLSYDVSNADVEDLFKECQLIGLRLVEDKIDRKPKGFGYVEFATPAGLEKAVTYNDTSFMGRNLKVRIAVPQDDPETIRDFSDWARKGPLPHLAQHQRQPFSRGESLGYRDDQPDAEVTGDFSDWSRKGPIGRHSTPTVPTSYSPGNPGSEKNLTSRYSRTSTTGKSDDDDDDASSSNSDGPFVMPHDDDDHSIASFDQAAEEATLEKNTEQSSPSIARHPSQVTRGLLGELSGSSSSQASSEPNLKKQNQLQLPELPKPVLRNDLTHFNTVNDFDDLSAILNPSAYFAELDELESFAIENCQITAVLAYSEGTTTIDICCVDEEQILRGILDTLQLMQKRGFCKEHFVILVEDPVRNDVIRAEDIAISDISSLYYELLGAIADGPVNDLVEAMLRKFGFRRHDLEGLHFPFAWWGRNLLCSLLCLATVSFAGSHCSDLGQYIWGIDLESVSLKCESIFHVTGFRRRRLACLDSFTRAPVWAFGRRSSNVPSKLSISLPQFALLWGPLYAMPSTEGFENLLAIETQGGIMFREPTQAGDQGGEVNIHWISTSCVRKRRDQLMPWWTAFSVARRADATFPSRWLSFPATGRLLIGQPTSSGSTTITLAGSTEPEQRLNLAMRNNADISQNEHCNLTLEKFGRENGFFLRPAGTHEAYYMPEELQIAFSGGQYVNVGIQKNWKRLPAVTHKSQILQYCSRPCANPTRIREILQLRVGIEMSACTSNARRVSLEEALKLACPAELQAVEHACNTGDPVEVTKYLSDLEATGVDYRGHALLYWPLSNDIARVLEIADPPQWCDILKDTHVSACFAVISGRCLPFSIQDRRKLLGSRCSIESGDPGGTALRTTIELHPNGNLKPPLKKDTEVKLATGYLYIRNDAVTTHLAFYESRSKVNIFGRIGRRGDEQHRELLIPNHLSVSVVELYLHTTMLKN